jgi:transcriptional regulator with XRE-family HTH domain
MERPIGHTLGQRLRAYREALDFSLSDLARRSGVSRSYLYQLENDESSPTQEKLNSLADALGVSPADLLGVADEPALPPALAEFAQEARLPPEDIRMLSRIHYRGKQPTTKEAWRVLYSVIRAASDETTVGS